MGIYGYIVRIGAKYQSFTLMFYGLLSMAAVNINTYLVGYPEARAACRIAVAVMIVIMVRRAVVLYSEKIKDMQATIKRLSEYER